MIRYATIPDLDPRLWQAAFFIDLVHTHCTPHALPPPELAAMTNVLWARTRYIFDRYEPTPAVTRPFPEPKIKTRKRRKKP